MTGAEEIWMKEMLKKASEILDELKKQSEIMGEHSKMFSGMGKTMDTWMCDDINQHKERLAEIRKSGDPRVVAT